METIMKALQRADYNLSQNNMFSKAVAQVQLHNAVVLLDKGYSLDDDFDEILNDYCVVEDVPEKEK